jgi:hypothetical protein
MQFRPTMTFLVRQDPFLVRQSDGAKNFNRVRKPNTDFGELFLLIRDTIVQNNKAY